MHDAPFWTRLRAEPAFADLSAWTITPLRGGITSAHTYRCRRDGLDWAAKEVKDNEARILRLLAALDLDVGPQVVLPGLLKRGVVVYQHVRGRPMRGKVLDRSLIARYARMQNALNRKQDLIGTPPFEGCAFTIEDDGFYRGSINRCIDGGYENLQRLRTHRLDVVEAFIEIADRIREHREAIADGFSGMPFGWLHHDFREAHIVGDPPRLLDWGSSYGHGPFLFDLGQFLLNDPKGLEVFSAHSEICQGASEDQIVHWVTCAACAGFAGFTLWRLGDFGYVDGRQSREACRALLECELPAYRVLLETELGM